MTKNQKKDLRELANTLRARTPSEYVNTFCADKIDDLVDEQEGDEAFVIAILVFVNIFAIIGIICSARYLFF